ncbi:MAG: hypothetical protein QCI82_00515 [Candidatus Thermoplasmatota archaeon]|nr:hypothetical protein [Candidatus Thermoplasmatota archaeon]
MDGPPEEGGYRVPSSDKVREIILKVLMENKTIRSQTKLHAIILRNIAGSDTCSHYRLSPERLRRIAASMPEIKMFIHCRESDEPFNANKCPVCSSSLENIRNQTLYGWIVNTGRSCPTCGYWTGSRTRKPVRYVFIYDPERAITGGETPSED